ELDSGLYWSERDAEEETIEFDVVTRKKKKADENNGMEDVKEESHNKKPKTMHSSAENEEEENKEQGGSMPDLEYGTFDLLEQIGAGMIDEECFEDYADKNVQVEEPVVSKRVLPKFMQKPKGVESTKTR